ncbi:unnamed protein product [Brassicogethes aeneus]|uniref:Carboxylesterase type B domain-containing protein n=1 Tax=Brassicogethes aeneus TaxID=1431903 RepID=A0A9P0FJ33_BRAAE|nr:unnamed protein product [Brassicogethes aeneus]
MKHTNTRILIIIYFNFLFIYGSLNNVEPFCQLRITTNKNLFFKACFGVPYALPPVEDLRFRLPIECNNWFNHLNFTKEKLPCIGFNVKGHEDCLYLNIFTPITKNNYLSVIVWIPGQFFLNADTTFLSNGPDYFIEQEVIFVTVSYRQGLFGFASTEDEVLPGNMGIADIFAALKWIKKYIKKFNGDGDNITIMAHGSGAVCVSILQQNYLSKGLFQRIILHSGSSLVTWGRSENSKRFILKLGKELNLNTNSTDSLVNSLRCYKNISRLHKTTKKVYKSFLKDINPLNGNIIGPVLTNNGKFLSGPAHESFFQNNFTSVPIIIGYTVLEAISDSIQYISGYVSKMNSTDFYMSSIKADEKYKDNIGSMIEKNYFMPGVEKNILRSLRVVSFAPRSILVHRSHANKLSISS